MKTLVLYNHAYQIEKVDCIEGSTYLQVGVCRGQHDFMRILESMALHSAFFQRRSLELELDRRLALFDRVIIFGCQEYLSWYAYKRAVGLNMTVSVIPDNTEFYLRPSTCVESGLNFKRMVKILIYGLLKFGLEKDYAFFGNKVIYSISKSHIDYSNAYFNTVDSHQLKHHFSFEKKNECIIYVSQPYYEDYSIPLDVWVDSLNRVLEEYVLEGLTVLIKFHQRDSLEFREIIGRQYVECDDVDKHYKFVGFFSTMLFELALESKMVLSHFSSVEHLFPAVYSSFVKLVSAELDINLSGERAWLLNSCKFENLTKII